jgi:diadenosine tetraphosphate (Ap4A) HIT family hydrolase
MTDFVLDKQLKADSAAIGRLMLCEVCLLDDSRYPWLVLVPRRRELVEIFDLTTDERALLMEEVTKAAQALKSITECYKLNVAALGNQVRQLHIHVIARFKNDAAWPAPVWGKGARVPYQVKAREDLIVKLRQALGFV